MNIEEQLLEILASLDAIKAGLRWMAIPIGAGVLTIMVWCKR